MAATDPLYARRLPDRLGPQIGLLLVGINPGRRSASLGHHFAGHGNRFWRLLHDSKLTAILLSVRRGPSASRVRDWPDQSRAAADPGNRRTEGGRLRRRADGADANDSPRPARPRGTRRADAGARTRSADPAGGRTAVLAASGLGRVRRPQPERAQRALWVRATARVLPGTRGGGHVPAAARRRRELDPEIAPDLRTSITRRFSERLRQRRQRGLRPRGHGHGRAQVGCR